MADFRIIVDVKDVAGGDIDMLAEDIAEDFGGNFDIDSGGFSVRVQQKVGDNYFSRDPGDDLIPG